MDIMVQRTKLNLVVVFCPLTERAKKKNKKNKIK